MAAGSSATDSWPRHGMADDDRTCVPLDPSSSLRTAQGVDAPQLRRDIRVRLFRVFSSALQAWEVGTVQERIGLASRFCWAVPLLFAEAIIQGSRFAGMSTSPPSGSACRKSLCARALSLDFRRSSRQAPQVGAPAVMPANSERGTAEDRRRWTEDCGPRTRRPRTEDRGRKTGTEDRAIPRARRAAVAVRRSRHTATSVRAERRRERSHRQPSPAWPSSVGRAEGW